MKLNDISIPHQQAIEMMKDQLLIVLFNRLGGKASIPVSEVDGTGKFNLTFCLNRETNEFEFEVIGK